MFVTNSSQEQGKWATCPSCLKPGVFAPAGEQPVPERVAKHMQLDTNTIPLWHCPTCGSTISGPDLIQD